MVIEGEMQASFDTRQPISENVVLVEMDNQVVCRKVSLAEIEFSSEVILGYHSPRRSKMKTTTPMRNPDGIRVSSPFDYRKSHRSISSISRPVAKKNLRNEGDIG